MADDAEQPSSAGDPGPGEGKADWPKTPDGTIDWETVFEAPEAGLIAMVSAANSNELLFKVTEKVIRQLFTRKGDEQEVRSFIEELTRITREADPDAATVDGTRRSIVDLLRRIKTGRIEKAAAYVAEQKQKASHEKKRRRHIRRMDDRKARIRKRAVMIAGGGIAAVVILIGIVGVMMVLKSSPDDRQANADTVSTQPATGETDTGEAAQTTNDAASGKSKADATADGVKKGLKFTRNGYPIGRLDKADLMKLGPHVMTLKPILYSRNVGAGKSRRRWYLPVLTLRDPDSWSEVCEWAPALVEQITAVMQHQLPNTGEVTDTHLVYAAETAAQLINQRLGGSVVDGMYLIYDVDRRMTDARARCRLLTDDR